MTAPVAILFDLDETLVHSSSDLPDAAPIRHALQLYGTPSGWMIGDLETDAAASAAAGIGFTGLRGGYDRGGSPEVFSSPWFSSSSRFWIYLLRKAAQLKCWASPRRFPVEGRLFQARPQVEPGRSRQNQGAERTLLHADQPRTG